MASDQNSLLSFNAWLTYNARAPMQPLSDGGGDRPYLRSQSSKSRGASPTSIAGVVPCNLRPDVYRFIWLGAGSLAPSHFVSVAASSRRDREIPHSLRRDCLFSTQVRIP